MNAFPLNGAALNGFGGTGGGPPPAAPRFRDRDAYEAIVAILRGTGEFDRVGLGTTAAQSGRTARDDSWANVQPIGDETVPDGSSLREFHRCTYLLTLSVGKPGRADAAFGQGIDRVVAVVRNALMAPANRSLGGLVLSGSTKLSGGAFAVPGQGDAARTLRGEFAYSVSLASSAYSVAK